MTETILIVGLGNPGEEYKNTPHNMGRLAVSLWTSGQHFPEFRLEKKFAAQMSEGMAGEQKIIVALPETFMNNSGVSVAAIANFYRPSRKASERHSKISTKNILVVHDDIDIPLGNVRVALGGSSAGHYGIESIVEKLSTANFWRFRVGIRPLEPLQIPLEAYVLQKNTIDKEQTSRAIARVKTLLSLALEQGVEAAREKSD